MPSTARGPFLNSRTRSSTSIPSPDSMRRGYGRRELAPGARLPERLVAVVGAAREDEEQVREPVEVADDVGRRVLHVQRPTLGAPADRAADVQLRGGARPARQDEGPQRLE